MTYDAAAQSLAITTLGTAETNMDYLTCETSAAISIGFLRWYADRAAALLARIKTENAASFIVPTTLSNDLTTYPPNVVANQLFWECRYLSMDEAQAVVSVLNTNKPIQNEQATDDIAALHQAAVYAGIDPNVNTQAALFFYVMFDQDPRQALAIIAASGPTASIDRLYAQSLNDVTFSHYQQRYVTAYQVITGNTPALQTTPGTVVTPTTGGDTATSGGVVKLTGASAYIVKVGDSLHLHFTDGHIVTFFPAQGGYYLPRADATVGAPVPVLPANPTPTTPPPTSGADATRAALVSFLAGKINRYRYSQGPTRLAPEQNLYTDCSGLMYYAYQTVAGINPGTWTGNQVTNGTLIAQGSGSLDQSLLLPGDLVFYNWSSYKSTYDHVEMFSGSGQTLSHGGPGTGPNYKTLSTRISAAHDYMVRRYV